MQGARRASCPLLLGWRAQLRGCRVTPAAAPAPRECPRSDSMHHPCGSHPSRSHVPGSSLEGRAPRTAQSDRMRHAPRSRERTSGSARRRGRQRARAPARAPGSGMRAAARVTASWPTRAETHAAGQAPPRGRATRVQQSPWCLRDRPAAHPLGVVRRRACLTAAPGPHAGSGAHAPAPPCAALSGPATRTVQRVRRQPVRGGAASPPAAQVRV